ncbi:3-isopropylmalate dehydratase small subunit [Bradyrhizobium sp. INPA03-11B]|uniref:3-isopropylmalate dehydratase small subunit n=1 Tax=Bradyrhizobium sp. INPA03-11B TaxID=418598 RepID=UPI00338DA565
MQKFTTLRGPAAPFMRQNVDTDVVIRVEHLLTRERDELGAFCFEALRFLSGGVENPEFLLNQPPWRGCPILLAGPNFGCGSSREGAVWALMGIGIRCVVAPTFGEIFFNNCFQNGVLPVVLPESDIETLAEEMRLAPECAQVTVDLEHKSIISAAGRVFFFNLDENRRQALLQGLDDISLTLRRELEIDAFQRADSRTRPWIYLRRRVG